jgi:hypothetical protein
LCEIIPEQEIMNNKKKKSLTEKEIPIYYLLQYFFFIFIAYIWVFLLKNTFRKDYLKFTICHKRKFKRE